MRQWVQEQGRVLTTPPTRYTREVERMRMTDRKVALIALSDAISWNQELLSGMHEDDDHRDYVVKLISAMRRLNKRLSQSKLTVKELAYNETIIGSRAVSPEEVIRLNATPPQ